MTKVGKILGHSSATETERYRHPKVMQMTELVNQRNARRAAHAEICGLVVIYVIV